MFWCVAIGVSQTWGRWSVCVENSFKDEENDVRVMSNEIDHLNTYYKYEVH